MYSTNDDELYHYGVIGMKWGVHRAISKYNANERLTKRAFKYDKKSAVYEKRSTKAHAKKDLGRANRKGVKSAKLEKRSAKTNLKATKTANEFIKSKLEYKAAKLKYKSDKAARKGNRLNREASYSIKPKILGMKSDSRAAKASKARMKIANNKKYIERMKIKVSKIPQEEINNGYEFVNKLKDI